MPAPTTQTSQVAARSSGGRDAMALAVWSQMVLVVPEVLSIDDLPRYLLVEELDTRQITFPTSSATSNAPRLSIATPTGRPMASPFSLTNPVNTSIGGPAGLPAVNETKITLYPLRGLRFHEPCCPMNMPCPYGAGRLVPRECASPSEAVCG